VATDRDDRRLAAPGDLELVRDFVNTLDILPNTDGIGDPASLASWIVEHRLVPTQPTLTEEDLGHARGLREALRAFLRPPRRSTTLPGPHDCGPGSTRRVG
jgi:Putative stress-induced transcription regulator